MCGQDSSQLQLVRADKVWPRDFSQIPLLYSPGRDHESCQESLSHSHGESERVLSYDYEVDQWENDDGVDREPVNEREKQIHRGHHLLILILFSKQLFFFKFMIDHLIFIMTLKKGRDICLHSTNEDEETHFANEVSHQSGEASS